MFNNFLRTNKFAMWFLTVIRIYLGYEWITAGWHKITGGFDAGGFLNGAIANSAGDHPDRGRHRALLPHGILDRGRDLHVSGAWQPVRDQRALQCHHRGAVPQRRRHLIRHPDRRAHGQQTTGPARMVG